MTVDQWSRILEIHLCEDFSSYHDDALQPSCHWLRMFLISCKRCVRFCLEIKPAVQICCVGFETMGVLGSCKHLHLLLRRTLRRGREDGIHLHLHHHSSYIWLGLIFCFCIAKLLITIGAFGTFILGQMAFKKIQRLCAYFLSIHLDVA